MVNLKPLITLLPYYLIPLLPQKKYEHTIQKLKQHTRKRNQGLHNA